MKDLKGKTIRGGIARMCAQGTTFSVRLASLMILARLLGPTDFGLIGMVTAFTGILNLFRDFGLSTATVQRASVTDEQISTLFWVNIAVGVLLTAVTIALAPALAVFYHEPRLRYVTMVIATGFFFNAAGVQHSALLQRQMRFTALAVINTGSFVIGTIVAIAMALMGFGYWALVAMTVVFPLCITLGSWVVAAWIPGLPQRRSGIRSMVRFGGTITLNQIVVYIAYNMEKVLLGRFWGADVIGVYGRAFQLVSIPTDNLNSAVGEVAFSALSRVQDEPERLRKYFLKGYSLVLGLTLPITIACALFAPDAILVILGPKWWEAAPLFRYLTPTILALAMINPFGWLLFATARVGRSLKIALVIAPLVITGYVVGLHWGPKGVALGYSTAMMLWVIPNILWCIRDTAISFSDVMGEVRRPLFSGIAAGAVSFLLGRVYGSFLPPLARLFVDVAVFLATYVVLLLFVMGQKDFYLNIIRGMRAKSEETLATV